ncbi:uncharacterized protein EV154DRAFT_572490 [Mucor mucedo]|uniref:uncharacterized protein n=1 Tax=Mucor mucedo TaxID=29922 RepID=UPI002220DD17|nr:uncharacterized protein EV154DRAFT_572490 [Mucor mucedo]KAI7864310.1 hypothetical protein EV154DRAFT_572490 [Mucor mucedo]
MTKTPTYLRQQGDEDNQITSIDERNASKTTRYLRQQNYKDSKVSMTTRNKATKAVGKQDIYNNNITKKTAYL